MSTTKRGSIFLGISWVALVHCGSAAPVPANATTLDAEAQSACAGVPDEGRAPDRIFGGAKVEEASPLIESLPIGKIHADHVRGARIVLRSEPGLTRPWLTRLVRCQVAMRAAGTMAGDAAKDPLAVGRPEVTVDERGASFVVAIRGRNDDEGREIARRARGL